MRLTTLLLIWTALAGCMTSGPSRNYENSLPGDDDYGKGLAEKDYGDYAKAQAHFERAAAAMEAHLSTFRGTDAAKQSKGDCFGPLSRKDPTPLTEAKKVVISKDRLILIYHFSIEMYLNQGADKKAIATLERKIAVDPECNPNDIRELGRLAKKTGDKRYAGLADLPASTPPAQLVKDFQGAYDRSPRSVSANVQNSPTGKSASFKPTTENISTPTGQVHIIGSGRPSRLSLADVTPKGCQKTFAYMAPKLYDFKDAVLVQQRKDYLEDSIHRQIKLGKEQGYDKNTMMQLAYEQSVVDQNLATSGEACAAATTSPEVTGDALAELLLSGSMYGKKVDHIGCEKGSSLDSLCMCAYVWAWRSSIYHRAIVQQLNECWDE